MSNYSKQLDGIQVAAARGITDVEACHFRAREQSGCIRTWQPLCSDIQRLGLIKNNCGSAAK